MTWLAPEVEVLDRYADGDLAGEPAVTRRRVGAGSATYVSADIGRAGIRDVLGALAHDVVALQSGPYTAGGDVDVIVRAGDEHRFVFLANRTQEDVAVQISGVRLGVDGGSVDEAIVRLREVVIVAQPGVQ